MAKKSVSMGDKSKPDKKPKPSGGTWKPPKPVELTAAQHVARRLEACRILGARQAILGEAVQSGEITAEDAMGLGWHGRYDLAVYCCLPNHRDPVLELIHLLGNIPGDYDGIRKIIEEPYG